MNTAEIGSTDAKDSLTPNNKECNKPLGLTASLITDEINNMEEERPNLLKRKHENDDQENYKEQNAKKTKIDASSSYPLYYSNGILHKYYDNSNGVLSCKLCIKNFHTNEACVQHLTADHINSLMIYQCGSLNCTFKTNLFYAFQNHTNGTNHWEKYCTNNDESVVEKVILFENKSEMLLYKITNDNCNETFKCGVPECEFVISGDSIMNHCKILHENNLKDDHGLSCQDLLVHVGVKLSRYFDGISKQAWETACISKNVWKKKRKQAKTEAIKKAKKARHSIYESIHGFTAQLNIMNIIKLQMKDKSDLLLLNKIIDEDIHRLNCDIQSYFEKMEDDKGAKVNDHARNLNDLMKKCCTNWQSVNQYLKAKKGLVHNEFKQQQNEVEGVEKIISEFNEQQPVTPADADQTVLKNLNYEIQDNCSVLRDQNSQLSNPHTEEQEHNEELKTEMILSEVNTTTLTEDNSLLIKTFSLLTDQYARLNNSYQAEMARSKKLKTEKTLSEVNIKKLTEENSLLEKKLMALTDQHTRLNDSYLEELDRNTNLKTDNNLSEEIITRLTEENRRLKLFRGKWEIIQENEKLKRTLDEVEEELRKERYDNIVQFKAVEGRLLALLSEVEEIDRLEETVSLQKKQLKTLDLENGLLSEDLKKISSSLEYYKLKSEEDTKEINEMKEELVQKEILYNEEVKRNILTSRCLEDEKVTLKSNLDVQLSKVKDLEDQISGREDIFADFVTLAKRISRTKEYRTQFEEYCEVEVPVKKELIIKHEVIEFGDNDIDKKESEENGCSVVTESFVHGILKHEMDSEM